MRGRQVLKSFLEDLIRDSIGLATEVSPLNIGMVASYAKKRFGKAVDISPYKYPLELERAIDETPPDILGLSNYSWSHSISMALFKILKQRNPKALAVMGGSNFPHDIGR